MKIAKTIVIESSSLSRVTRSLLCDH